MDRPDKIEIRTCTIGGHLMGGAYFAASGYKEKYNSEKAMAEAKKTNPDAKPVDVEVIHSPPYFFYFTVTKKKGDEVDKKGGCFGLAFFEMLNIQCALATDTKSGSIPNTGHR